jgi:DNA-binding MarR family transcriptional regulator
MVDHTPQDLPPLGLLAARLAAVLEAELFSHLHSSGFPDLRPRHASLLTTLEPSGARLTVLAERAGVSPQSMGEVVDDLERKGYLERTEDPTDRRARLIGFTPKGLGALTECLSIAERIESRLVTEIGRSPYDATRQVLTALLAGLRAPNDPPPAVL